MIAHITERNETHRIRFIRCCVLFCGLATIGLAAGAYAIYPPLEDFSPAIQVMALSASVYSVLWTSSILYFSKSALQTHPGYAVAFDLIAWMAFLAISILEWLNARMDESDWAMTMQCTDESSNDQAVSHPWCHKIWLVKLLSVIVTIFLFANYSFHFLLFWKACYATKQYRAAKRQARADRDEGPVIFRQETGQDHDLEALVRKMVAAELLKYPSPENGPPAYKTLVNTAEVR